MNVVQALAQVSGAVASVGKDSKSPDGYRYRGIDDVINALHGPMARAGVVLVPHVVECTVEPWTGYKVRDIGGKPCHPDDPMAVNPWTLTRLTVEYHVHGPDGDALPTPVRAVGLGIDNADKGTGKAMSYAYKTAISQLFAIPTDDPAMNNESATADDEHRHLADLRATTMAQATALKGTAAGAQLAEWIKARQWPHIERMSADQCLMVLAASAELAGGESSRPGTDGDVNGQEDPHHPEAASLQPDLPRVEDAASPEVEAGGVADGPGDATPPGPEASSKARGR